MDAHLPHHLDDDQESGDRTELACLICLSSDDAEFAIRRIVDAQSNIELALGGVDGLIKILDHQTIKTKSLLIEIPPHTESNDFLDRLDHLANYIHQDTRVFGFGLNIKPNIVAGLIELGFENCISGYPDLEFLHEICSDDTAIDSSLCTIGIVGMTGGAGASLIALNLAHHINVFSDQAIAILNGKGSEHSYACLFGKHWPEPSRNYGSHAEYQIRNQIKIIERHNINGVSTSEDFNFGILKRQILSGQSPTGFLIVDCGVSSSILRSCDHILLVAEPDFKNLNALHFLFLHQASALRANKINILLNKIDTEGRVEFKTQEFLIGEDLEIYEFYKFSPAGVSAALASRYPLLPAELFKSPDTLPKLLSSFGIKYLNTLPESLVGKIVRPIVLFFARPRGV